MKVLGKKDTKNMCNLWVEFLNNMKNIKAIKKKIDKCEYIKILDFCAKQLNSFNYWEVTDQKIFQGCEEMVSHVVLPSANGYNYFR